PDINGKLIADAARAAGHRNVYYVEDVSDIPELLKTIVQEGDLVLTMGAGDIWKVSTALIG
ncbi:MAG: UDP-N-acetylmuramate--L-alanine ligase, partial [Candidatus Kapabacteria bacterium]|nr:UDP-N-acetylmuramate--L-alanine ligase [Candidatus Kapabacteria bacterium]